MKRILCLIIFMASVSFSFAQSRGSLHVDQDSRIESLIAKQRSLYRVDSSYNGYRIHIFMEIGNEALDHARAVKAQFERAFPDIPIYLSYAEPHFRLRAGDFRNRVEAEQCLRRVKPRFKEAFVTQDKIFKPRIELNKKEE
ncbi:MAG: SPOR domain-containing protein [Bacteroidales bacterium]|nr:SPOR domain-containing protein [Bacteroidales bacterium]